VRQWRLVPTRLSGPPQSDTVAVTHAIAIASTDTVAVDLHDGATRTGLGVRQWRLVPTGLSGY
jgi:hypothetical protein